MPFPVASTDLPIEASIAAVRTALADHGHAVLVAPPGSGKTTVVPLRLLDEPWLEGRRIVMLEPRRLATRAAANRMAHLAGEKVGGTIGYVTRDDRRTGPATRIQVVTEGVLTRRLQRDAGLPDTGIVIFDEVHERNLQTDLGLALTLDVRRHLRPDLRILVMSATIDGPKISELLGAGSDPAPLIESAASAHPVEISWAPLPRRARIEPHAASALLRALVDHEGDALVFLPGMGEMVRTRERLLDAGVQATIHLLHGNLSSEEQDAALEPSAGRRKIVLSTDIAETSLTVEGVRLVVDSGLTKSPRFDPRTGMTRLQTVPISRASADQRAGRAGRVAPGAAIRLWSKLEHGARSPHTVPEITHVELSGLALELAAWGSAVADLDFIDPPPARAMAEATALLQNLGAVDGSGRLTNVGRLMSGLPVHPRLARMVVEAGVDGWLACLLAAIIDDRDVIRGHPDEVPVDIALRTRLVTGEASYPHVSGRSIAAKRRSAEDIARRAGVDTYAHVDHERAGRLLALAYPDRLAVRRGSPGRFQLRTGTTAWMTNSDPLGVARFVIAADLDGKRRDARIRLAAHLSADDVADLFAHDVTVRTTLVWQDDRLMERRERKLGGLILDSSDRRPTAGRETAAALAERLRATDLADLTWTKRAVGIRARLAFLHSKSPDAWPNVSTEGLLDRTDEWLLGPLLRATGLDDLTRLDVAAALLGLIPPHLVGSFDRLAPESVELPGRRALRIDYGSGSPTAAIRVQALYGVSRTPEVAGEPVTLHLLSPADRPIQITADLAGFWRGSWHEVRKEMAGRYPKHSWPEDPASAAPDVK